MGFQGVSAGSTGVTGACQGVSRHSIEFQRRSGSSSGFREHFKWAFKGVQESLKEPQGYSR